MSDKKIRVNIDGSYEPTDRTAAYGGIIRLDDKIIHRFNELYSPKGKNRASNNTAEYCALGVSLKWLKENGYKDYEIEIQSDSQLVINQMWNGWRIKDGLYVPFAEKCKRMLKFFPKISGKWIPREQNKEADALSRERLATQDPFEWFVTRKFKSHVRHFMDRSEGKVLKDQSLKRLLLKLLDRFE